MSYELRYYQDECISHTFDYINKGGRAGVAVLPTATGKSIVIAEVVRKILQAKNHIRIMMLTHSKELIEQNYEKLTSLWPTAPAGIYSAGIGKKQFQYPIIFGGIQSCYRKPELFGHIDMIIVDECHLISEKAESMYGSFIDNLKRINPNLVVIGFTATPYRLGMGYLTDGPIFDDIYYDISTMDSFVRLIDEGYLSDLIPIQTDNEFDLSNVKKIANEFSEKSLDENLNRDAITREVVAETMMKAQGRNKGMAFCVSISHCENMCNLFNEAGLKATFVHSKIKKSEREQRIEKFKAGEYNMMVNVGVLTTGFDAPDVDYLVVARPTESTVLHVQIMGRGMRIHPSKENCLVLDFAGNTIRLGPVNDPVVPMAKGCKGGQAPIRICEQCGTINHASVRACKSCGFIFPPPKVKIETKAYTTDLIKRGDVPNIKEFNVDSYDVHLHKSARGNNVVKITFRCGPNFFDKYLMLDSKMGGAYTSSLGFWNKFGIDDIPKTCEEAITILNEKFKKPDAVKMWLNKPVKGQKSKRKELIDVIYRPT